QRSDSSSRRQMNRWLRSRVERESGNSLSLRADMMDRCENVRASAHPAIYTVTVQHKWAEAHRWCTFIPPLTYLRTSAMPENDRLTASSNREVIFFPTRPRFKWIISKACIYKVWLADNLLVRSPKTCSRR